MRDVLEILAGLISVVVAIIGIPLMYMVCFVLAGMFVAVLAASFWYGCLMGWFIITWIWNLLPFALII